MRVGSRRRATVVHLERLAVVGGETLLMGASGLTVRLAARPDRALARRVTAGLHHLAWVRLSVDGETPTAELYASARRPVRRRLPVAAALALAEAGVPTLVVGGPHR